MPENTSIVLVAGTKGIADRASAECTGLMEVTFAGTIEQWRSIFKEDGWRGDYLREVECRDGTLVNRGGSWIHKESGNTIFPRYDLPF